MKRDSRGNIEVVVDDISSPSDAKRILCDYKGCGERWNRKLCFSSNFCRCGDYPTVQKDYTSF